MSSNAMSDRLGSTPKGHTSFSKAFCFVFYQPYTDHSTTLTIKRLHLQTNIYIYIFFTQRNGLFCSVSWWLYICLVGGDIYIYKHIYTHAYGAQRTTSHMFFPQGLLCFLSKSFSLTQDSFDWASLASQQTLGTFSDNFPQEYKCLAAHPSFFTDSGE